MSNMILLNRSDIQALIKPADYLAAVEHAFRAAKEGRASSPPPMHIHGHGGCFHAKGAALDGERNYVALKLNGNFPGNPARTGLPTIQGAVLVCDADNGSVLALLDSIEITLRRTAAASALAARHLAKPRSEVLAIVGCGDQARPQAEAIAALFPPKRILCFDIDMTRASAFAEMMGNALGAAVTAAGSLADATREADIIVTCTTAQKPFLTPGDVKPGAFIAAVGADNPGKSEIDPALMKKARVVVDSLDQCSTMGDLHHALDAGAMTKQAVHAELADIVVGARPGRSEAGEIFIFDSTGTALQDVTSAALAYERARDLGRGQLFSLT